MVVLEDKLGTISGGRVLDIATGEGGFILMLKESLRDFEQFVGIDITDSKFNKAREKFEGENISFAKMDGAKLAFSNDCFDTVTVCNSLHHLGDIPSTLQEMKRVLRPGGNFLIFEMFSDNQSPQQINHVDLHHWWAAVNRLEGIPHNPTMRKAEIIDFVNQLNLHKVEFVEHLMSDEDREDEETLEFLFKTIDEFLKKLESIPDSEKLMSEGRELRRRIEIDGFAWATELVAIGKK
ncbi:MAG: class I SAM-dependent methyltransferase [Candidatus Zixiibacteriota bacterium]